MANNKSPRGFNVIFPDDLEEYIAEHREGTYQLIDVRQPEEHEEFHLPGSRLIPLPQLVELLKELDRASDTIVYCAVGGRSLIAAQFLAVRGFQSVFQLQGGIEAWEDRTATGSPELHLQFIRGDESPVEAAAIAYRFEVGIEQFHRAASARSQVPEVRDLLEKLMRAEESHRLKLLRLLESLGGGAEAAGESDGRMEGGFKIDDFLARNGDYLKSAKGCLELAMMIEVQALDLYLRMAQTCSDAAAKELFYSLGDEEKAHLRLLAELGARIGQG
jgi:sulfur-carrier protein adenylyltransferase/sulfurtransferase